MYRVATGHVQRLADLVAGLRRVRSNVPHGAIGGVLVQRQRAVSHVAAVFGAN